jgi:hypothetical protein
MSRQTEIRKSLIALIKEAAMRKIPLTKNDAFQKLGFDGKKESESEPWRIEKSDIHGKGLFATRDIEPGGLVAHSATFIPGTPGKDTHHKWDLSEAARYTNHAADPNTMVTSDGENMKMVAASPIKNGDEIRVSYFQVSGAMGPGTELTYKGVPRKPVEAEELSKWAMDVE